MSPLSDIVMFFFLKVDMYLHVDVAALVILRQDVLVSTYLLMLLLQPWLFFVKMFLS